MNNNYYYQQQFLDQIKEFSISNTNKEINNNFIYSQLMGFNLKPEHFPYAPIKDKVSKLQLSYMGNPNINVFTYQQRPFLWFDKGKINGNEVKLYIPMDYNHIEDGAKQLFDFIASTGMIHQSKIAYKIRNDNVVVRVLNLKDAQTIIDFVSNNKYIQEGLMNVNPFLPNCNGIGIAMDNSYSYNGKVCEIINDFFNYLKQNNRLDLFTVEELNKYVKNSLNKITDLELKDIYNLIEKTTRQDFKLQDFVDHANNKLIDKYSNYERITDPAFYLEEAIRVTNQKRPLNTSVAIQHYLKGNPNYFTNQERVREGLIKYVEPGDLINLMRSKLKENNIELPNNDEALIQIYLKIILNKNYNNNDNFEILKNAYINTMSIYDENQARVALGKLILNKAGAVRHFTNRYKDRDNLKKQIVEPNVNVIEVILNNIDITDLDINNINEIITRFEDTIGIVSSIKQNVY